MKKKRGRTARSPLEPLAKRGLSHQMDQLEKRPELSLYTIGLWEKKRSRRMHFVSFNFTIININILINIIFILILIFSD